MRVLTDKKTIEERKTKLYNLVSKVIDELGDWGSFEVFIQNGVVVQVATKKLEKLYIPKAGEYKNNFDTDKVGRIIPRK